MVAEVETVAETTPTNVGDGEQKGPEYGQSNQNFDKFISDYAIQMNFIIKGGNPDLQRATNDIVKRFQNGGFGRVTFEDPNKDISEVFAEYERQLSGEVEEL